MKVHLLVVVFAIFLNYIRCESPLDEDPKLKSSKSEEVPEATTKDEVPPQNNETKPDNKEVELKTTETDKESDLEGSESKILTQSSPKDELFRSSGGKQKPTVKPKNKKVESKTKKPHQQPPTKKSSVVKQKQPPTKKSLVVKQKQPPTKKSLVVKQKQPPTKKSPVVVKQKQPPTKKSPVVVKPKQPPTKKSPVVVKPKQPPTKKSPVVVKPKQPPTKKSPVVVKQKQPPNKKRPESKNQQKIGNKDKIKIATIVKDKASKNENVHKKNVTGREMSDSQNSHIKQLISDSNPFRSFLNTDIKWIGQMTDLKLETIAVPAGLFKISFWTRLSGETNIPLAEMKTIFGIDFEHIQASNGKYMIDITEQTPEGDYINLGALMDFLIKNDINTRKLFICVGINPDVFTVSFEDQIVGIVNQFYDLLKIPFKYGETYIEKMYREAADSAIKTLESYASISPSGLIDKKVEIYSNKASEIADQTAMQASTKIVSFKESSSKLASNVLEVAKPPFLPAAHCSLQNPCHRYFDLSSVDRVGISTVKTYNSISVYATQAYETSVNTAKEIGNELGPSSTAFADLTSKTFYAMSQDESSKIIKVPYVLFFGDATFMDRILTMPQLIIDVNGDYYKPYLMVADPMLRYMRYLFTAEWDGSLQAGVNPNIDITAKIFGSESQIEGSNIAENIDATRVKRDAEGTTASNEMQMVREYNGKVPPGGYKTDFAPNGDHSSTMNRILNAPSFLTSAGGPIYTATAVTIYPFFETFSILLHSTDPYFVKIQNVEKALDNAPSHVLPIASIVKAIYPTIDLVIGILYGEFGLVQIGLKIPTAISSIGNVVFDLIYKDPVKIGQSVFHYTRGDGGLLSMATLPSSSDFEPKDGGVFPIDGPELSGRSIGKPEKITKMSITNLYEPAASFVAQISAGLLGNILNPAKVKESGLINFKFDPVTSYVKLMLNPAKMYKLATDQQLFLQVVLGGQNPESLLNIGIDAAKMLENDIDPAKFLAGGLMMIPEPKRAMLGTVENPNVQGLQEIGINGEYLQKVNLNNAYLLYGGLMSADDKLLKTLDINKFNFINRLMRNSVVNEFKFLNLGIDFNKLLSSGLRPDFFFAAGLWALDQSILNNYQVNIESPTSLNNIGINTLKITSKNISTESLIYNGLKDFTEHESIQKFGINKNKLMKSFFGELNNETLVEIGIDVVQLAKSGYRPLKFILGIPELLTAEEQTLTNLGIDKHKLALANIDFNTLMKDGVTSKMYLQFYRRGIRLQHLMFSVLSNWGLEQLIADPDNPIGSTVNLATATTRIVAKPGAVGRALNVSELDPSGNIIKFAKSTMKKFTGEETGEANARLLLNSYLQGNKNYRKLLNVGNAVRILTDRENATQITNPFNENPSTPEELQALYADLPSPTVNHAPQVENAPTGGFWG